jgi:hypothetical protein
MTLAERRVTVRQHLEAAVRLQRESWDEALAIQQAADDQDRDIYAFVAELAGAGLADDEAIPEDVVDVLISRQSGNGSEKENIQ